MNLLSFVFVGKKNINERGNVYTSEYIPKQKKNEEMVHNFTSIGVTTITINAQLKVLI